MSKLIYVYGDDQKLLETLTSALRDNGYTLEYTGAGESSELAPLTADIALICKPQASADQVTMGGVTMGGVTMDFDSLSATDENGVPIHFTPTEFSMLGYLMKNANRAVPRNELLAEVWNFHETGTRVADDTVKRLRKKLEETRLRIETVWGYGFKVSEAGQK